MTTPMYCLYVGVDYTYIDVNALAQGINFFLSSQVWFQAVAGARNMTPISPQLPASHDNHSATETDGGTGGRMYVWMNGWMKGRRGEGGMDGQTDGWDGWMNGWTDGRREGRGEGRGEGRREGRGIDE